jgi:hypothetical protein
VLGDKTESYQFIRKALVKFNYATFSKLDKGVARRWLLKLTGYSNPQLRRLIGKYKRTARVYCQPCRNNGFALLYSAEDVRILAKMDERPDRPCSQAVKKLNLCRCC